MATSNTPPKPEDYGLTSDRVEWLSKHIPELESWEQEYKKTHVAGVAADGGVGIVVGYFIGGVVGGFVGGFIFDVVSGRMRKEKPPVEISDGERDRFSNYQKALRDQEHQQE